jgi:PEGA domain.
MIKKLSILTIAAFALSGCAVVNHLQTEEVVINSKPSGAAVYIAGELKGTTPLTMRLPKDVSHSVVIRKPGYQDKVYTIGTNVVNPYVKFGPLVDVGYYYELVPNPSGGDMKPDFLPEVPGLDKFNEMMDAVVKANALKDEGKVEECEHSYMLKSISEFYAPETKNDKATNYDLMSKRLASLKDQKERGLITDAEYRAKANETVSKYAPDQPLPFLTTK